MVKQNILIILLLTVCFLKSSEHEEQSRMLVDRLLLSSRLSTSNLRLNDHFIIEQGISELEMQKSRDDAGRRCYRGYPVGRIFVFAKPSEWAEERKKDYREEACDLYKQILEYLKEMEINELEKEKDFQPKK